MSGSATLEARKIVAHHLEAAGRPYEAKIVARGGGDDFPEVIVAARALRSMSAELERLKRSLSAYADAGFWGNGDCHTALAFHDQGEIAREALMGRDPLAIPAG
jgi:hypothetical protein